MPRQSVPPTQTKPTHSSKKKSFQSSQQIQWLLIEHLHSGHWGEQRQREWCGLDRFGLWCTVVKIVIKRDRLAYTIILELASRFGLDEWCKSGRWPPTHTRVTQDEPSANSVVMVFFFFKDSYFITCTRLNRTDRPSIINSKGSSSAGPWLLSSHHTIVLFLKEPFYCAPNLNNAKNTVLFYRSLQRLRYKAFIRISIFPSRQIEVSYPRTDDKIIYSEMFSRQRRPDQPPIWQNHIPTSISELPLYLFFFLLPMHFSRMPCSYTRGISQTSEIRSAAPAVHLWRAERPWFPTNRGA
jgi:hypothetical protein